MNWTLFRLENAIPILIIAAAGLWLIDKFIARFVEK